MRSVHCDLVTRMECSWAMVGHVSVINKVPCVHVQCYTIWPSTIKWYLGQFHNVKFRSVPVKKPTLHSTLLDSFTVRNSKKTRAFYIGMYLGLCVSPTNPVTCHSTVDLLMARSKSSGYYFAPGTLTSVYMPSLLLYSSTWVPWLEEHQVRII